MTFGLEVRCSHTMAQWCAVKCSEEAREDVAFAMRRWR